MTPSLTIKGHIAVEGPPQSSGSISSQIGHQVNHEKVPRKWIPFPCQGHYFFNAFLHRQYPCGFWAKSSPQNIRPFFVKWPRPFLHTSQWGSKKLLSAITMKSPMVITHNKTRKCVLRIFCNLSVNMQMRHYLIPDVLQIMHHLST